MPAAPSSSATASARTTCASPSARATSTRREHHQDARARLHRGRRLALGLRDRDGGLIGGTNGGTRKWDTPRSSFWLTLVVDGPFVEAFIDNQPLGRYHGRRHGHRGQVGFATGMGAVAIEGARITRSSAAGSRTSARSPAAPSTSPRSLTWAAASMPERRLPRLQGSLLLWIPPPKPFDEANLDRPSCAACRRTCATSPRCSRARNDAAAARRAAARPELEGRVVLAAEAKKQLGDELRCAHAQAFVAPPPETGVGKDFLVEPWLSSSTTPAACAARRRCRARSCAARPGSCAGCRSSATTAGRRALPGSCADAGPADRAGASCRGQADRSRRERLATGASRAEPGQPTRTSCLAASRAAAARSAARAPASARRVRSCRERVVNAGPALVVLAALPV